MIGQNESLAEYIRETDAPPGEVTGRVAIDLMSGTETANGEHGPRVGDRILLAGWKCIDGYLGLEPARRLDYRQPARCARPALRGFRSRPRRISKIGRHGQSDGWYAVGQSAAAGLAGYAGCRQQQSGGRYFAAFHLADEALVDRALPSPVWRAARERRRSFVDRPGRIELNVDCPTTQLLVVGESYHEGWRATIDGQPTGVVRANGDFLGLVVPGGRSRNTPGIPAEKPGFRPRDEWFWPRFDRGIVLFWPRTPNCRHLSIDIRPTPR